MKTYAPDQIRNIALAGHASKGKTTLLEAMLHLAGATERAGKVADGNTVTPRRKSATSAWPAPWLPLNIRAKS